MCCSHKFFITIFLFIQIYLPVSYYISSEDFTNERFAWRMLSETKYTSCELRAFNLTINGNYEEIFIMKEPSFRRLRPWFNLVSYGEKRVTVRLIERLCDQNRWTSRAFKKIRYSLTCSFLFEKNPLQLLYEDMYC